MTGQNYRGQPLLGDEFGWSAHGEIRTGEFFAASDCGFIILDAIAYQELLQSTPQLNYQTRKLASLKSPKRADWILPAVDIY